MFSLDGTMQILKILVLQVAFLICFYSYAIGNQDFSDEVLVNAFEKGSSLAFARILSVREEQGTRMYFYKVRLIDLIVPGDLSPRDIEEPIELFAGASYGSALKVGTDYAIFVTKDAPYYFSWTHRDSVIKLGVIDPSFMMQFMTKTQYVYGETCLCQFRKNKSDDKIKLPPLSRKLRHTFKEFKEKENNRCDAVRSIYLSDVGSRKDESQPWSSIITFLPPKLELSRTQALFLLGDPTIKVGFTYKWFCGRYPDGEYAGVLTIIFNKEEKDSLLMYGKEEIGKWVK